MSEITLEQKQAWVAHIVKKLQDSSEDMPYVVFYADFEDLDNSDVDFEAGKYPLAYRSEGLFDIETARHVLRKKLEQYGDHGVGFILKRKVIYSDVCLEMYGDDTSIKTQDADNEQNKVD